MKLIERLAYRMFPKRMNAYHMQLTVQYDQIPHIVRKQAGLPLVPDFDDLYLFQKHKILVFARNMVHVYEKSLASS